VLSLILLQSRSYGDIAGLLRLEEEDVRARAHTAAKDLVQSGPQPDAQVQAEVIDYILGEQTVSERARTRSMLEGDPAARDWATRLVDGLAPLAEELPAIPGAPTEFEPPSVVHEPTTAEREPVRLIGPQAATVPPRRRWAPRWTFVPPLALLLVAAIIVIIALGSGGGGAHRSSGGAATHLVLVPVVPGTGAGGSATVEHHRSGLVLLLRGHGLPANTGSDAYAVWLYSGPSNSHLLGFVSPPVGHSGSFTNSVVLPTDAGRYRALIVTVETVAQPSAPGRIVLRGALRLP
jgi:hypothetical protein